MQGRGLGASKLGTRLFHHKGDLQFVSPAVVALQSVVYTELLHVSLSQSLIRFGGVSQTLVSWGFIQRGLCGISFSRYHHQLMVIILPQTLRHSYIKSPPRVCLNLFFWMKVWAWSIFPLCDLFQLFSAVYILNGAYILCQDNSCVLPL